MIAIMLDDLQPLLASLARRELAVDPGASVFLQGDSVRHVFFVCGGEIHLVRHQKSGASLVLQRAGPGAMLAEASLYSDKYHCDAIVIAKASLLAISKRDFLKRMGDSSELALAIIRRLAQELQQARLHAEILSMKTVAARLDAWLGWRGVLPPKGEWLRLAAELGVSPEAIYREIAKRRRRSGAAAYECC